MRYLLLLMIFLCFACSKVENTPRAPFTQVEIQVLREDSTSIRALEVTKNEVMYAGSNGMYGNFNISTDAFLMKNNGSIDFLGNKPAFRSIASTKAAFFILSIAQPALLYRHDRATNDVALVYIEDVEGVFYDAMTFWNDQEGIAMGDAVDGCISVIITRDGGLTWEKKACTSLPHTVTGEAAFAASNTNIKTIDEHAWIITGGKKSRVLHSPDKGKTWSIAETPITQGTETSGAYTMDFYNNQVGIIYGGDYTAPDGASNNVATTMDGGSTWQLAAINANQGYKSCVQYVPNSNGMELVALGFTGISYSSDGGQSWAKLSKEPFLSFRFLNDSIAYAGGRNKLARLTFR